MRTVGTIVAAAGLLALAVTLGLHKSDRRQAAAQIMGATQSRPSGQVMATVNGETILESELMAALPDDAFDAQLQSAKLMRLQQLVEERLRAQFLNERRIAVSKRELEKGIDDFTEMVMTPGCPCCGGGYASLDEFMKANHLTASDIRRTVSNNVGFTCYRDRLLRDKPADSSTAPAAKQRPAELVVEDQIEQEYKAAHDQARIQYSEDLLPKRAGGNP